MKNLPTTKSNAFARAVNRQRRAWQIRQNGNGNYVNGAQLEHMVQTYFQKCESEYVGSKKRKVCMYFNGGRWHWYKFCTSTGYVWISLVPAVFAQVVCLSNPY